MIDLPGFTIFDLATYCIIGLFVCVFFMNWYLKRHGDDEVQQTLRGTIWLELAFVYRDFTRYNFGKGHYVYHLSITLLFVIIALFVVGVFTHLQSLESGFRLLIGLFAATLVTAISGVFYFASKKTYYK